MTNFIFECEMWGMEWTNGFMFYLHMCHELYHYGFIGKVIYSIKLWWDHLHWNCNLKKMV
jgi:hypothetical protein